MLLLLLMISAKDGREAMRLVQRPACRQGQGAHAPCLHGPPNSGRVVDEAGDPVKDPERPGAYLFNHPSVRDLRRRVQEQTPLVGALQLVRLDEWRRRVDDQPPDAPLARP